MKKWTLVLVTLFVAACFFGCSDGESQKAAELKHKAAAEETRRAEESRVKAEKKAKDLEEKKRIAITQIRVAFGLEQAAEKEKEPVWVKEMKGGEGIKGILEAKKLYAEFNEIEWARKYLSPDFKEFKIDWAEVGLEEKEAMRLFKEKGLETAKALFSTFKLPYDIRNREQFSPKREGDWSSFSDGDGIMRTIIDILVIIGAEPKDIGTNPNEMKSLVLRDLKTEILETRKRISDGKTGESDAYESLTENLDAAIKFWNFAPAELGLNKKEMELLANSKEGRG